MIVAIIAVLIGLLLIGAGGYYFIKEKSDKESRKIYMITMLIGVIIVIGALVKIFLSRYYISKKPHPSMVERWGKLFTLQSPGFPRQSYTRS